MGFLVSTLQIEIQEGRWRTGGPLTPHTSFRKIPVSCVVRRASRFSHSVSQVTLLLRNVLALDRMGEMMVFCCKGWQERAGERNRRTPPKVARTASAFLARSAEGEAPHRASYGSNAAALSLYSQQRGDASFRASSSPPAASTCCHGASAPRAMIQSPSRLALHREERRLVRCLVGGVVGGWLDLLSPRQSISRLALHRRERRLACRLVGGVAGERLDVLSPRQSISRLALHREERRLVRRLVGGVAGERLDVLSPRQSISRLALHREERCAALGVAHRGIAPSLAPVWGNSELPPRTLRSFRREPQSPTALRILFSPPLRV